jgi:hypothetical protein
VRRVLIGAGTLLMLYALGGAALDHDVNKVGVPVFFVAVLVLHDGVFLPAVLAAGAGIRRVVPDRWRGPVRGAALVSLAVSLVAVPLAAGPGLLPYGRGLLVILVLIWSFALLTHKRRLTHTRRPE